MSNSIHRCPNCSYMLVLLERRGKYKCAKCGRLFFQKEIETETFRNWNQKQRETDLHNIKIESKRPKLTEEEKQQRREEYIEKNKDKIKQNGQLWRDLNKTYYNQTKRLYYDRNLEQSRHINRMRHWRRLQRDLVLQSMENGLKESTANI